MINNAILGVIAGARMGSPSPTDPYWSDVVLLLHFDGADASTTIVDSSSFSQSVTAYNGAALTTANKKAGTASCRFTTSGAADRVEAASSATMLISELAYTLECWVYKNSASGYQCIAAVVGDNGIGAGLITFPDTNKLAIVTGGGSTVCTDPDDFPLDEWVHVAQCRDGAGDVYLAVNGQIKATGSHTTPYGVVTSRAYVGIWLDAANFVLDGDVDEARLTLNVARYTSNFTPPTAPFPTG